MERMEELIRQSLEARAQDVEPTPALWLEVDRRVARRRRFQVLTWSLAGATAAVLAVFAVPAAIGLFSGPDQLDIAPLDRTPAAGVVSTHAVAVDAEGTISLVDLRTGATVRELASSGQGVADLAVSPVSTREAVEFAAIAPNGELSLAGEDGGTWSAGYPDAADGFGWSVVVSPDGRWAASTAPTPESDGATVVVAPFAASAEEDTTWTEAGMVLDRGSRLVAWTGAADQAGDLSELWVVTADGRLVHEMLEVIDGVPTALEVDLTDEEGWRVLDAATSFVQAGEIGEASYLLAEDAAGPVLVWRSSDGSVATTNLGGLVGDVDAGDLWLDAKQDAALVGDGERTWLLAHDGAGAFVEPVELEGIVRAALLDPGRPGAPTDEPTTDPTEEPTEEPTDAATEEPADAATEQPTEPETGATGGPTVEGAPLPAPIVTISLRDLVLHGPDGPRTLYTLPAEGESIFLSARVRPGSTLDDLTVVALASAEGMFDLREYRWDGRELAWDYLPDHLQPGVGGGGTGAHVHGPVWSPDGAQLAWFEFGTGAAPTLRTIGWRDAGPGTGDPATDNASFELDTRGQNPLIPVEWVATPGGPLATEIRAVALDSNEGWYALPLDIQSDGAVASDGSGFRAEPGDGTDLVVGVADDGAGQVRWLLQLSSDGPVLVDATGSQQGRRTELPDTLMPGDGLVELSMRPLGDGVIVASPHTSVAYHVTSGGELARIPGEVIGADAVR
jgi:hypothetical protein